MRASPPRPACWWDCGRGRGCRRSNVIAITNLVSSAVEGLTPELVSVVDMNGNLLSRPRRDGIPGTATQITEEALEYRQAVEHDLVAKINNTLEPLLGADKFRTGVSADIDMTSGEQSEETFDPSKSVMVSSQKTEDTQRHHAHDLQRSPGTAANLPPQQSRSQQRANQQPAATPPAGTQPAQAGAARQAKAAPAAQQLQRRGGNTSFHHPAFGKHHLSNQPHHQTSETSARHHQAAVDRGAGGSGIQDGRARAPRPIAWLIPSGHRKVESHSDAGGNFGWLGHDARRSAHRGSASV